jgi:hypothetical protein
MGEGRLLIPENLVFLRGRAAGFFSCSELRLVLDFVNLGVQKDGCSYQRTLSFFERNSGRGALIESNHIYFRSLGFRSGECGKRGEPCEGTWLLLVCDDVS